MWRKILAFDGEQTIIRQKDALGRSGRIESCDSSYCDCWGQNFQGIQGAEEILCRIGTQHTTLGIDCNKLGTPGLVRIIDGLEKRRASIDVSEGRGLEISDIEAASCRITDEGVEAIMAYAARDDSLRSVQLEGNGFKRRLTPKLGIWTTLFLALPPDYILVEEALLTNGSASGLGLTLRTTQVLPLCTRHLTKLAVSGLPLETNGIIALIHGLPDVKLRLESFEDGGGGPDSWDLTDLSTDRCEITDEGLAAVLEYVSKRAPELVHVELNYNLIELRNHLRSITASLNSSHLVQLQLKGNNLQSSGVVDFFTHLNSPNLLILDMTSCQLGSEAARSIVSYMSSPRCRRLIFLVLRGNNFDYDATKSMIDALEMGNFTLRQLNLDGESHERFINSDPRLPAQWRRIVPLTQRNNTLTKRVMTAAIRSLPYARILLNAEKGQKTLTGTPTAPFRILDLPAEVLHIVIRHTSGDTQALSNRQFAKLVKDAEGKAGLRAAVRVNRAGKDGKKARRKIAGRRLGDDLVYVWADMGGWTRWDQNVYRDPASS